LPAGSAVRQNCQAAGVPASFVQLGNTILTTVGGNSALQPEDADTLTVGLVYEPSFVENLALTLDYWEIDLEDSIQQIPGSEKLAICFNSAGLNHPFCQPEHVRRDPLTGDINFLSAQPSNVGLESASGIDLGVGYSREIAGLDTRLTWNVSYLDQYDVTPFIGGETIEYAGMITGGRGSYAHWRSDASLDVSNAKWFGSYSVQYIGGADDINVDEGPGSQVGSLMYHNVQAGYFITDQLRVAAGVDNLLDKEAPYVASWTDGNTDTLTYDLLGRRCYLKHTCNL
jgi:iron complex outermembrane recepter protein